MGGLANIRRRLTRFTRLGFVHTALWLSSLLIVCLGVFAIFLTRSTCPISFFCGTTTPSGTGPPHYRGFTITPRHTTVGRTPLEEWSVRYRDLYL